MKMRKYFSKNEKWIVLILLTTIGSAGTVSIIPLMTKKVIDNYASFDMDKIIAYSVFYTVSVIAFLAFEYLRKFYVAKYHMHYSLMIKSDIFEKLINMNHIKINSIATGDIVNTILNDTENVFDNYVYCWVDFAISVISFVIYLSYMIYLNLTMAAIIVAICFLSLIIPKLVGKKLKEKEKIKSDEESKLIEAINGLVIGSELFEYKSSPAFMNLFDNQNQEYEQKLFNLEVYRSFTQIFSGFSLYLINIVAFISGMILCFKGLVSISSFIAIIGYIDLVAVPVRDMIFQIIMIHSSEEIRGKLSRFLSDDDSSGLQSKTVPQFQELCVDNLTYSNSAFFLTNISIKIKAGRKYAITGDNGSGKSTIMKLMAGERSWQSGNITINGINIQNIDERPIVYYSSEPAIFEGSLADNLTLFGTYHEASKEAVEKMGLDNLRDKEITYQGDNLSFGEKCRINLLRAVTSEKPVLLLDEPFANVDPESERELTNWLLQQKSTIVIITHNQDDEYLRAFDEVYRIANGKIIIAH